MAVRPAHVSEKGIDRRQHGIYRGNGIDTGDVLLPSDQRRLGERLSGQIPLQGVQVVDIFLYGLRGAFLLLQMGGITCELFLVDCVLRHIGVLLSVTVIPLL